jgi:hypothetical protein
MLEPSCEVLSGSCYHGMLLQFVGRNDLQTQKVSAGMLNMQLQTIDKS